MIRKYTCQFCGRHFFSKHGRPSRPLRYCGSACSNRMRSKKSKPGSPWNFGRMSREKHDAEVLKVGKTFSDGEMRYIPLVHTIPDAIAIDLNIKKYLRSRLNVTH